jgi:hypothetical protein
MELTGRAGFDLLTAASTLLWEPEGTPEIEPRVEIGIAPEAGFLGMLFVKQSLLKR